MNSMAFLQEMNANIVSFFNLVLLVELAIVFILGMREGVLAARITTSQFAWLTALTAISFYFWQICPPNFALLAVLPQTSFWVFAGALVGCILKKGYSNLLRSL